MDIYEAFRDNCIEDLLGTSAELILDGRIDQRYVRVGDQDDPEAILVRISPVMWQQLYSPDPNIVRIASQELFKQVKEAAYLYSLPIKSVRMWPKEILPNPEDLIYFWNAMPTWTKAWQNG